MTFKYLIARAVIAFALLISPSLAMAMTAEEAFAFIIFNVQDGDTFPTPGDGLATVNVTSKEPLTYHVAFAKGDKAEFSVTQQSPCVFDVVATLGEDKPVNIVFNMNEFIGINSLPLDRKKGNLQFATECSVKAIQTEKCIGKRFSPGAMLNPNADIERITRAIAYFKKEFCAGTPF